MPRNAAVRFGSTSTPAIVRSANHREQPRKTTKARGSYLPVPKILRIQQRYLNGQNKSEIALEENCDRETVTRIVQFPEVQNFIAQAQQEFFGLIPDAIAAVLLEARDRMGVKLPPEAEEALANDARECAEAAKTSGARLLRR